MANLNGFDARTVEPIGSFEPLPAGTYEVVIVDSDMKPTKSGTGQMLVLEFEVVRGEYKGRKLWSRLNIDNPSEKAVQIARGQLAAICLAVGVPTPRDSTELHNLPLQAKVKCREREDNGEISNDVTSYKAIDAKPAKPAEAASAAPWIR